LGFWQYGFNATYTPDRSGFSRDYAEESRMKPLLRAVAFLPQQRYEIAVDLGSTAFPGLGNQGTKSPERQNQGGNPGEI